MQSSAYTGRWSHYCGRSAGGFLTGVVGGGLLAALLILVSLKKEAGILKRVKEGDILVTIKASNDEVPETSILEDNGAEDVNPLT